MILKIAVCDDEKTDINAIEKQLLLYEMSHDIDFDISSFCSGAELLKEYTTPGTFHILFLDVEMPDISGIELAKRIRAIPDRQVKIVFISNYPEYMKDSFDVHAFHYLPKPFNKKSCQKILNKLILDYTETQETILLLHTDNSEELVYINDIIRIETANAKKRLLRVITNAHEALVHGMISKWETELAEHGYMSPSRGHLINMNHLHFIRNGNVIMSNGDIVPLSRQKEKKLRTYFSKKILLHTREDRIP